MASLIIVSANRLPVEIQGRRHRFSVGTNTDRLRRLRLEPDGLPVSRLRVERFHAAADDSWSEIRLQSVGGSTPQSPVAPILRDTSVQLRRIELVWRQKAGAENAGVENAGAITHGKLSEEKTIRYQ